MGYCVKKYKLTAVSEYSNTCSDTWSVGYEGNLKEYTIEDFKAQIVKILEPHQRIVEVKEVE
jgi:hypothetical protein